MELSLIGKYAKVLAGIVLAAAIAGLLAMAFGETYQHGYHVAKAEGDKALANYKASIAQASVSAASEAFGRYAADVTRGQAAESGFINVQTATAEEAKALKEQIDGVTQPPRVPTARVRSSQAVAGVTGSADCLFSRGFVRLWNAAAGAADDRNRALQASADTGVASDRSNADAAACSGVSQADILDWFVDYSNRAHGTENKLKAVREALPARQ